MPPSLFMCCAAAAEDEFQSSSLEDSGDSEILRLGGLGSTPYITLLRNWMWGGSAFWISFTPPHLRFLLLKICSAVQVSFTAALSHLPPVDPALIRLHIRGIRLHYLEVLGTIGWESRPGLLCLTKLDICLFCCFFFNPYLMAHNRHRCIDTARCLLNTSVIVLFCPPLGHLEAHLSFGFIITLINNWKHTTYLTYMD